MKRKNEAFPFRGRTRCVVHTSPQALRSSLPGCGISRLECVLRVKAEVRTACAYGKPTVLPGWEVGWGWGYDRSFTTPPGSHEVISAFPRKSETEPLSRQADRQLS